MSLHLPVALFYSLHSQRHGGGVGLGSDCLTVGIWDFHVCVCVHARMDYGRCASMPFAPAA